MTPSLDLCPSAYVLRITTDAGDTELARLEGGPAALLPGRDRAVGELELEAAIERAEDWLMPHAARVQGGQLRVHDPDRRLTEALGAWLAWHETALSADAVEALFARAVELCTGRAPPPWEPQRGAVFMADLVLLRELVHHGRLGGVTLAH